jgi:flavocytochrome c
MEITYALMKAYEALAESKPKQVKLINKARVNKLLVDAQGRITGAQYEKDGKTQVEKCDSAVISTGGYGAGGLFDGSLLYKVRPDLCHLPTTNGEHCVGDGITFAMEIGAAAVDLQHVQVHPTGLVHLDDPDNRTKFLAAEALRGEGGLVIDRDGNRFCDDLGTRDYVTMSMWNHNKGPYRLILNEASYKNIEWHCKHYCGRRVMKHYENGFDMVKETNIPLDNLKKTFADYNSFATAKNDPWGKKFFNGTPWALENKFMCATITPVLHYTMGGLVVNDKCEVRNTGEKAIPGLYAAGEVTGGVHGRNRLGGSALLECVALGRVAGANALAYNKLSPAQRGGNNPAQKFAGVDSGEISTIVPESARPKGKVETNKAETDSKAAGPRAKGGEYTLEEVAKHKTANDVWVVVDGKVLDVTKFLPDHPGGKMAIMAFAGRDATTEFNMVHEKGVIEKYAPETVIGKLKGGSKL